MYHLLGNDVEDDTIELPPREVVKKTTTSKKSDAGPSNADPSKAKNKPKVTGNQAALKNKTDNKKVEGPTSTTSSKTKKPFDKHSRTNKTDSKKKLKQGWGENDVKGELDAEIEGAQDAEIELNADNEIDEPKISKKSLKEYFDELKTQQQGLSPKKILRTPNQGSEDKWSSEEKILKEREVLLESNSNKTFKSKQQKKKQFLEIDAVFADQVQNEKNPFVKKSFEKKSFDKKDSSKKPFTKKPFVKKDGKKDNSSKPEINDKNFPSL